MKEHTIIGIDPGKNGGIAARTPDGDIYVYKMPAKVAQLQEILLRFQDPLVFIEKLNPRPEDLKGGKIYGISKLMANFEQVKTALELSKIPYVLTHPMKWQNGLQLRETKGDTRSKEERKNDYKEQAQAWYPSIKVTLWNADAILIMTFGKRMLNENLKWVLQNLPQIERTKL